MQLVFRCMKGNFLAFNNWRHVSVPAWDSRSFWGYFSMKNDFCLNFALKTVGKKIVKFHHAIPTFSNVQKWDFTCVNFILRITNGLWRQKNKIIVIVFLSRIKLDYFNLYIFMVDWPTIAPNRFLPRKCFKQSFISNEIGLWKHACWKIRRSRYNQMNFREFSLFFLCHGYAYK